jgi:hypothetical protein
LTKRRRRVIIGRKELTMDFPPITEEKRIELVKAIISSKDGRKTLALSVKNATKDVNPDAKNQCIEILRKIAGDKEIDIPVGIEKGVKATESMGEAVETVKVSFADLLIQQLEENLTDIGE